MGIGIDIIEISRIDKAVNRHKRFLEKIFTEKEIEYFNQKNMKPETIAGYFAAKEAVGKALGCGVYKGKWRDIEVVKDDMGMPYINLYGQIKEYSKSKQCNDIMISISHCKTYAVANAIALNS